MLPEGGGDGGGVRNSASTSGSGVFFSREELVQPFRVDFAAQKIGFGDDAAEKAGVGFDSGDGVFIEGAAQTRNRFFAGIAPGDQLAEQRIVFIRNGPALVDAFIEADPRAARSAARENPSG